MAFDREQKLKQLEKVSNMDKVLENIEQFIRPYTKRDIFFDVSTRNNNKYMIKGDFTKNKFIHFGHIKYEDFTKHNDETRRLAFMKRNSKWLNYPPNTAAFLSYILLW